MKCLADLSCHYFNTQSNHKTVEAGSDKTSLRHRLEGDWSKIHKSKVGMVGTGGGRGGGGVYSEDSQSPLIAIASGLKLLCSGWMVVDVETDSMNMLMTYCRLLLILHIMSVQEMYGGVSQVT